MGFEDEAHGGHGGLREGVAFGDVGVWFEEGFAEVVGVFAGGDAIEGGADDATFSIDDVAAVAGGDLVGVEEFFSADGVGGLEFGDFGFGGSGDEFVQGDVFPFGGSGGLAPASEEGVDADGLAALGIEVGGELGPVFGAFEGFGGDAWALKFVDVEECSAS